MTQRIAFCTNFVLFIAAAATFVLGCNSTMSGESSMVNTQENPPDERLIEESDLYKLVDNWLYVQNAYSGLNVIDVSNPDQPFIATRLNSLTGEAGELYVREDDVFVLFKRADPTCVVDEAVLAMCKDADQNCDYYLTSEVAAVTSPTTAPQLAGRFCLPGHLVASRIVGDVLYIITSTDDFWDGETWIFSIDISDPGDMKMVDRLAISGEGHEIHVTDSAIYIAQSNIDRDFKTWIRYIDISDPKGAMDARGDIVVTGSPAGRFHMDEYNNTFRIVTFTEPWEGTSLHVIDISDPDALFVRGSLTGIAPEEDLHATRFVDDKVYIVTYESMFLQTDPLWVISLADPGAPEILGHLIIPGWSDYIFPRGNRLLAVGRGDRGQRVAASLFDVSDPKAPIELRRLEFGDDQATSEANTDFRGVRIVDDNSLGETSLMVVPVSDNIWEDGLCEPVHYLQFIDILDDDLALRGRVIEEGVIRRAVPIGNRLYAITDQQISAVDVSDRDNPVNRATAQVGSSFTLDECTNAPIFFGNGEWENWDDQDYSFGPLCSTVSLGSGSNGEYLLMLAVLIALLFLRRESV